MDAAPIIRGDPRLSGPHDVTRRAARQHASEAGRRGFDRGRAAELRGRRGTGWSCRIALDAEATDVTASSLVLDEKLGGPVR
jgi:hypothetical protein